MIENKNKIDEMNGFDISLEEKMENDGRSETVFGQSGGGGRICPPLFNRPNQISKKILTFTRKSRLNRIVYILTIFCQ